MLKLSIRIIVANKEVKEPVQHEHYIKHEKYFPIAGAQRGSLTHHNWGCYNPNDEYDLREVIPYKVPVITWRDDELTYLLHIALIAIPFLIMVNLAVFIHEHDLGLTHLAHHSDNLLFSS